MSDRVTNLPLPDQLADVRAQLKALETRELELKNRLIADPNLRTGTAWIAEVKEQTRETLDVKELRAMHADLVDEYTHTIKHLRVVLMGVTEDGEVVSARAMRNIER